MPPSLLFSLSGALNPHINIEKAKEGKHHLHSKWKTALGKKMAMNTLAS